MAHDKSLCTLLTCIDWKKLLWVEGEVQFDWMVRVKSGPKLKLRTFLVHICIADMLSKQGCQSNWSIFQDNFSTSDRYGCIWTLVNHRVVVYVFSISTAYYISINTPFRKSFCDVWLLFSFTTMGTRWQSNLAKHLTA